MPSAVHIYSGFNYSNMGGRRSSETHLGAPRPKEKECVGKWQDQICLTNTGVLRSCVFKINCENRRGGKKIQS
jgi:hypothetical protein